jgi:small GTP-binding protein
MCTGIMAYKCVLVGDAGVGKSAFLRRCLTNDFTSCYIPTVGVNIIPLSMKVDGDDIIFNIWDIGGAARFSRLLDTYFLGADCAIIMVDAKQNIKDVAMYWNKQIRQIAPSIPVSILVNKIDAMETYLHALSQNRLTTLKSGEKCYFLSVKDGKLIHNGAQCDIKTPFSHFH